MMDYLCYKYFPLFRAEYETLIVEERYFFDAAELSSTVVLISLGEGKAPEDENGKFELQDHTQTHKM